MSERLRATTKNCRATLEDANVLQRDTNHEAKKPNEHKDQTKEPERRVIPILKGCKMNTSTYPSMDKTT